MWSWFLKLLSSLFVIQPNDVTDVEFTPEEVS